MITFNRTRHNGMWEWIAQEIERGSVYGIPTLKRAWPGWGPNKDRPCNECFACEAAIDFAKKLKLTNGTCENTCPLIWEDPNGSQAPTCTFSSSIYMLADDSRLPKRERATFARIIAHLPLSKAWTDELARDPARVRVI